MFSLEAPSSRDGRRLKCGSNCPIRWTPEYSTVDGFTEKYKATTQDQRGNPVHLTVRSVLEPARHKKKETRR